MPEDTSTGSTLTRLLPVVMPIAVAPALGEWHGRGLCVGEDPGIFFPGHGSPGTEARQVCALCRYRDDCLEYATEADEFGIWGGLDQDERRRLRKKRHRQTAKPPATALAAR
jgi:WhiB family redox-sensing transcriptional regulator